MLLHPSPGEVMDRLSILSLKICHGRSRQVAVAHWEAEQHALLEYLDHKPWWRPAEAHLFDLAAVNAHIWRLEEELRDLRLANVLDVRLAQIASDIQAWNDWRRDLIGQIDRSVGVVQEGPEKLLC